MIKKLPTLYKKTSKGKIQIWQVEADEGRIEITTGQLDGKRTTRCRDIKSGKNIGKSNQTTPTTQAQAEAQSAWNKKRDSGYFEDIDTAQNEVVYLPMLAHKYNERKHNIVFPAYVQPKLDGVRCLAIKQDGKIIFKSRGGKDYEVLQKHEKLVKVLNQCMSNGDIYDGEMYVHGWTLQRIVSAVKKYREDTDLLEFHVFDIPNDKDFYSRYKSIVTFKPVMPVTTIEIKDHEQVQQYHDKFVREGYEGVIVRNNEAPYAWGHRSKDLQKYKEFIDEEFEIVGTYCETNEINGERIDSICFRCKTKGGDEFESRPKGTLEDRAEMWEHRDDFIGKMLTVRYMYITDPKQGNGKAVPQPTIGITVRDYE